MIPFNHKNFYMDPTTTYLVLQIYIYNTKKYDQIINFILLLNFIILNKLIVLI